MSFLAELRRRNVIRMAGLYLVGAWLITQVAATVLPLFDAPGWMARSVVVFPAPSGPIRPNISPARIDSERSRTASTAP